MKALNAASILPDDGTTGTLVGRVWLPSASGPSVVAIRGDGVFDVTQDFPTVCALAEVANPAAALRAARSSRILKIGRPARLFTEAPRRVTLATVRSSRTRVVRRRAVLIAHEGHML